MAWINHRWYGSHPQIQYLASATNFCGRDQTAYHLCHRHFFRTHFPIPPPHDPIYFPRGAFSRPWYIRRHFNLRNHTLHGPIHHQKACMSMISKPTLTPFPLCCILSLHRSTYKILVAPLLLGWHHKMPVMLMMFSWLLPCPMAILPWCMVFLDNVTAKTSVTLREGKLFRLHLFYEHTHDTKSNVPYRATGWPRSGGSAPLMWMLVWVNNGLS